MERVMEHDEIAELLGAYALDALEPDEAEVVARHLETCPRCSQEVDAHREAAGALAFAGESAPEGLWERIEQGLEEPPPDEVDLAPVVPVRSRRADRGDRRRTGLRAAALVVAAAAAVVIAVLGVQLADLRSKVSNLSARTVPAPGAGAVAVELRSPDGVHVVPAVLTTNGTGFVFPGNLPALPPDQTYQLWAIADGKRISVGVLGNTLTLSSFKADGKIDALAITTEDAPGVSTSTKDPVVVGPVHRTA
jgi:anti-sigma factor RsiW